MKISNIQQVTMAKFLRLFAFLCVIFFVQHTLHAQGEALFKSKCSSCHQIHKNGTGPMLAGARQRWIDAGEGDLITKWVQNNWIPLRFNPEKWLSLIARMNISLVLME